MHATRRIKTGAESWREDGKTRKRTLANLSALRPSVIEGLKVLLKGGVAISSPEEVFVIERSLPHGHVAAVLGLGERRAEDLHRALDWLHQAQPQIEQRLAHRHPAGGTIALYDLSSTWLTGHCCELWPPRATRVTASVMSPDCLWPDLQCRWLSDLGGGVQGQIPATEGGGERSARYRKLQSVAMLATSYALALRPPLRVTFSKVAIASE
ncbi:MAG: hypothetical protein FWF31_00210 [Desulfobulbus sp.]|nr:hypothetical protein [Desulfobulbus sp.]